MFSEFVTTVSRGVATSARATSVVVVPAGQPDRGALGDPRRRLARDPQLLLAVPAAAVAQRQLVEHAVGDRAAVRAREQVLVLEQAQVAADGGGRHAELGGQVAHADAAVARQALEDAAQPVGLAHARSLPRRVTGSRCLLSDSAI